MKIFQHAFEELVLCRCYRKHVLPVDQDADILNDEIEYLVHLCIVGGVSHDNELIQSILAVLLQYALVVHDACDAIVNAHKRIHSLL